MSWQFCLEDIAECGSKIADYTRSMSLQEFRGNQLVFDAVVRNLEIIGEAVQISARIGDGSRFRKWCGRAPLRFAT